jgi:single-stranded-DNA-specific exonuclease
MDSCYGACDLPLDIDKLDAATTAIGAVSHWIAAVNTQYNPVFGMVNLVRDSEGAMLNLASTELKGMQKAVDRICSAIEWNERILIYGDYDVDGTSSVAVVYSFLKSLYAGQLNYYIPHRYKEGYGLSKQGIDFAKANGHTLLITLDCGIKSADLVDYANGLGIDVIICDHHLPDERIPNALAILNPKQTDCTYPYKELSACGIGFKLIEALAIQLNQPKESVYAYLDLVATSIAADIVALDGENRVLGFYGIKKANEQPSLSLKTLLEASDFKRTLQMSDLVFVIGPRVNAAGRMDDAKKAVELFIETDEEKAKEIAAALQADNLDRKEVDKTITEQAIQLLQHPHQQHKKSTVLFQTNWHKGVVGIVASRLIDHYYRPTIVLTESNGMASGSARSIPGFNIHEAIEACSHLLENYGGHYFAAGMTMQLNQGNTHPIHLVMHQIKLTAPVGSKVAWEYPGYISILLSNGIEISFGESLSDDTGYTWNTYELDGTNGLADSFEDLKDINLIVSTLWEQAKTLLTKETI